eukprot:476056_1
MLNTNLTKNRNTCCGCLSLKSGVGLLWFFDLLLCGVVLLCMYMIGDTELRESLRKEIKAPGCQSVVQMILLAMVSGVAVVSGAIGVFAKMKLALKVFNIASIIESVQIILGCICLVIVAIRRWMDNKPYEFAICSVMAIIVLVIAAVRIYGHINSIKFAKSAN